jgi:hypothetical protein
MYAKKTNKNKYKKNKNPQNLATIKAVAPAVTCKFSEQSYILICKCSDDLASAKNQTCFHQ